MKIYFKFLFVSIFLLFIAKLSCYAQKANSVAFDSLNVFILKIEKCRCIDTCKILNYENGIKDLIEKSDDNTFLFSAYSKLAELYQIEGIYNLAIQNFFKALEYKGYTKERSLIAEIYDNLGAIFLEIGSNERMLESVHSAIKIKEEIGDFKGSHKSKIFLCRHYRYSGNYMKAFRIGYEALFYFEDHKELEEIPLAYNNIARTYKALGNFDKALELYNISYGYFERAGDEVGKSMNLNNIGNLKVKMGNLQGGLIDLEKSLEIEERIGNKFNVLKRYNNIGIAFMYLGNYEQAIQNFRTCIEEYKNTGRKSNLANTFNSLAMCYEEMDLLDSAKFYYLKSIELSIPLERNDLHAKSSHSLSEIYEAKGDLDSALIYLNKYHELFDEMNHAKLTWEISSEEFEYMRLRNKRLQKAERKNLTFLIIIGAGVFVLFVLIFLMILLKQKANIYKGLLIKQDLEEKQEELEEQIKTQNKELISKILQLSNDNSGVKFTIQKLNTLKSDLGVNSKQKVQQIINELENAVNSSLWDEFEHRFTKVHPMFYKKLYSRYPNLTAGEKKLCALIHLNFTPKEIAFITKQSPKSILVAKSRLRSKLNLDENVKISNFIQSLTNL